MNDRDRRQLQAERRRKEAERREKREQKRAARRARPTNDRREQAVIARG